MDAPVSGAIAKAKDATLAIMAGGRREALQKAEPVLRAIGKDLFHVGPVGAGHAVKALNNYLGAAGTLAGFEALLIAQAFGLEPQPMLEAINASTGRNNSTENKFEQFILNEKYNSGFALGLMAKDITLAMEVAEKCGVPAELGKATLEMWKQAEKELGGGADHTAIARYVNDRK